MVSIRERVPGGTDPRPLGGLDDAFGAGWLRMIALEPAPQEHMVPLRDARLVRVLGLVEDALRRTGDGSRRSVPSAGALYPYDVVVVGGSGRRPQVLRPDLTRGICAALPLSGAAAADLRAALDEDGGIDGADHVVLLARPWLSMRKYGPRGHLYTQLDAGHAATSLLGTALGQGPAVLRLRVPRRRISACLDPFLPYREVHSVVSVEAARKDDQVRETTVNLTSLPRRDVAESMERFCWSQIPEALRDGGDRALPVTSAPVVVVDDAPGGLRRIGRHEWRLLTRLRQSCKRFDQQEQPADGVAAALEVITTALPTDLPDVTGGDGGVRVSVLTGPGPIADACRRRLPGGDIRLAVSDAANDPAVVTRLCLGQRHIGWAKALVMFHLRTERLLRAGRPQDVRDALFRASAAAHLIYLGAARNGVAVTAVGGFDTRALRSVAGIGDGEEAVYLMALGVEAGTGGKLDRLAVAHAHGE